MITILVPTAKRPELLVTALRSISEQNAVDQVAEIIVSENAGDPRSGDVCKQFPNLPIKYILRDVQVNLSEHFSALSKVHWAGEFTVMLHDDDWWTPDYLAKSLGALQANPQASGFCCNSFYVKGETVSTLACSQIFLFWMAANYPRLAPFWELGRREVIIGCIPRVAAHYSTIMARAKAFQAAAVIYDTENRYDTDRMLAFELSSHGTLLYSPIPHAFYRLHGTQDTHNFSRTQGQVQMIKTTEWMLERSGEDYAVLAGLYLERFRNCPEDAKLHMSYACSEAWGLPILMKHLDASSELVKLYAPIYARLEREKRIKSFLGQAKSQAKKMFRTVGGRGSS
jgi:glycosyltransferase involved in cell wall biosynthesis